MLSFFARPTTIKSNKILRDFCLLCTASYLQRLGELDKISLYSLAGVDLGAQTDHLAAQLQTLLLQGSLT